MSARGFAKVDGLGNLIASEGRSPSYEARRPLEWKR